MVPTSKGFHSSNTAGNGQPRLRDQLCLLIRQHNLDPNLVKAYAADFCGTEVLSAASRELVESFISHLATAAKENREAEWLLTSLCAQLLTMSHGQKKAMQQLRQKRTRLKLSVEDYKLLRHRVLERDGCRCQHCGSSKDLQIHHLAKRSKLGDDTLDNLITLCVTCHQMQHHFPTTASNVSS
jgi:5-methylcytosine-specific restriction endonuclease McrA